MKKISMTARLRSTVAPAIFGAALISMPAFAQDAPQTADDASEGEAIIVTGSRIQQANLTSAAPVTVVNVKDIRAQGTTRVEDLLNTLPSVSAGQSSGVSNAATGTATVDLRGLGVARTLVLVNGRRLMPGDPADSSADLNAIPANLIKRIEVLTGGASSTYGADAVAGVVNFMIDTDYTGFRLDAQYSMYQHNNRNKVVPPLLDARQQAGFDGYSYPSGSVLDGGTIDLSATVGTDFDDGRGHITAYAGYRKVKAITQDRRDYSACTLQDTATALQCGGSATSAEGNIIAFADGTSTFFNFGPNRTLLPGPTRYNFAPTNYYQRPDERYTAGFFANYEINDSIKPYVEFMFMDDRTLAQIAPSGDFGNTLQINSDNPLISAQQRDILFSADNLVNGYLGSFPLTNVSNPGFAPSTFIDPTTGATYNRGFMQLLRRNVEGGPRIADLQHTQFRTIIGSKGDLSPAWSYDAYYQYGRTNYSQVYSNEFSVARLTNALDAVTDTRAGSATFGQPICRSVLSGSDLNCVPYDVFSGAPASQASIDYLSATGFQKAVLSEQVVSASITGLLGEYGFKSPLAEDGVALNLGAEYRKESLDLKTDQAFSTGDLTGQGAPTLPIQGSFNVKEVFGEIQIPLIQNGFVDTLALNGGYRYSKYSISNGNEFSTDTYKFGIEFAPVSDIRFRASYNRAARAPNLQELFAPNIIALDGSTDPCSGFVITAADVGCLAQGLAIGDTVTPNPAGQYNGLIGGTATLRPEKATTKTLGVVIQPRFLPRFALTVDYYDIKVDGAIQGFGSDAIVNFCTATADPTACALINRNPVNGSLWLTSDGYITNLQQNIGGVRTKGIDVGASYSHDIGETGTVSLNFQGTYLDKFYVDNGLSEPYDCAGYYGSTCSAGGVPSAPNARWRHKARASFDMPNGLGFSLQWRYFGPVKVDFRNPSSTTQGSFDPFSSRLGAQSYFDLSTSYRFAGKYEFRLGVNNILDRQPPLVTSGRSSGANNQCPTGPCNGNTYPAVYDALGRYIFAGITLDF
ncbi:TonB-dependent receptor domain-containing protein [Sphingobium phenoxybenzoativorans]|nr:TonB-dependent receptor [Sphingobium phenoxybenzoativorans]